MKSVGFIGGGRITRIFLQGLHNSKVILDDLVISEPDQNVVKQLLAGEKNHHIVFGTSEEAGHQNWVFLAVHPPVLKTVLEELKSVIKPDTVVMSLAPVLTINEISGLLEGHEKIARMIPNAASMINKGFNPLALSKGLSDKNRSELIGFMKKLGDCPEVAEEKLEAYAILTAMGPTYLWPQIHTLTELGEQFGLTGEEIDVGMQSMLAGAAELLFQGSLTYNQVLDLIPVKPMETEVDQMCEAYRAKLSGLYNKLKKKN